MSDSPILKQHARFCHRLKQARLEMEIKQQQVAAYLQLPISAVSAFESGKRRLGAWELYQLSKLYCKPVQWFFDETASSRSSNPDNLPARVQCEILPQRESLMFEEPQMLECLMLLKKAPRHLRQKAVAQLLRILQHPSDEGKSE